MGPKYLQLPFFFGSQGNQGHLMKKSTLAGHVTTTFSKAPRTSTFEVIIIGHFQNIRHLKGLLENDFNSGAA